jgi:hypothetical protein
MSDGKGNSIILLIIGIVLLWFAVTDKLSRVLDAYDVLMGNTQASGNATAGNTVASAAAGAVQAATGTSPVVSLHLPSLPTIGQNPQVGIS